MGNITFVLSIKCKFSFPSKSWSIDPNAVLTDKPSNTYVRAPGSTQGHAAMENVMEHLAHQLGMDPLEFRMINMVGEGKKSHPLQEIIKNLRDSSEYDKRKTDIDTFNKVLLCLIQLQLLTFSISRKIFGRRKESV